MKFASFRYNNKNSFGLIKNNKIVDLTECIEGTKDLREAITKDQLSELMELSISENNAFVVGTISRSQEIMGLSFDLVLDLQMQLEKEPVL